MYKIAKRMEISGAHKLDLAYPSKCSTLHGHNWIIKVEIESQILDCHGLVLDFEHIKNIVNQLDHENINDILREGVNPTAENIAFWIWDKIEKKIAELWACTKCKNPEVTKVTVQESEGNEACYIP